MDPSRHRPTPRFRVGSRQLQLLAHLDEYRSVVRAAEVLAERDDEPEEVPV